MIGVVSDVAARGEIGKVQCSEGNRKSLVAQLSVGLFRQSQRSRRKPNGVSRPPTLFVSRNCPEAVRSSEARGDHGLVWVVVGLHGPLLKKFP